MDVRLNSGSQSAMATSPVVLSTEVNGEEDDEDEVESLDESEILLEGV